MMHTEFSPESSPINQDVPTFGRRAFLEYVRNLGVAAVVVRTAGVAAVVEFAAAACGPDDDAAPTPGTTVTESTAQPDPEATRAPAEGLADPAAKRRAEQIISSFENSTTDIQYDYAEVLDDGRGITAGRAGFTSATDDLLEVVERYLATTQNRHNALARYLGALRKVDGTESIAGLKGFVEAWQKTSQTDPALNAAQDAVYDELYFGPAMKRAAQAGVHTAVGQTIILDTIIQHGEGDDQDGLPALMAAAGPVGGNERVWLERFLSIREHDLLHPADQDTAEDWAESVDRVRALRSMLDNPDLTPPLTWTVYGDPFHLDA